jgi:uncharacterized protein YbbC (DUF1343 family)
MTLIMLRKYTNLSCVKSICQILLFLTITFVSLQSQANEVVPRDSSSFRWWGRKKPLILGIARMDLYFDSLVGKRVAIVSNQTSTIGQTHLVDTLITLGIKIQKVFSPEHGFRGNADNGEKVHNEHDVKTGLDVISLYGHNRKPSREQLADVDVVLFDIQDVGVRFYTYISTLHYVMEACAEYKIPLIVLDRPNPNAHYIDGPVRDEQHKSFIGMHPVPIVYGMTIGEYAKMINKEYWLKDSLACNLFVVPCKNYTHATKYVLPIPPSPNLRSEFAISLYPSLCLFEGTTVSVGRGTDTPFEIFGHPMFPTSDFQFTPTSGFGSKKPVNENKVCNGYDLKCLGIIEINKLNIDWIIQAKNLLGDSIIFIDQPGFFDRLAGTSTLRQQINSHVPEEEIRKSWEADLDRFRSIRKKYLLYD